MNRTQMNEKSFTQTDNAEYTEYVKKKKHLYILHFSIHSIICVIYYYKL